MKSRPLSPHLQIYRWEWTMLYSILHRLTGVALSLGALFLVGWLVALAVGSGSFGVAQEFFGSVIGRLMLFGWSWALFYHLCNGVRHLVWDSGMMLALSLARFSGHFCFALSVILTLIFWACALLAVGG